MGEEITIGPQTPTDEAIAQLLDRYGRRICALGLRLCGNPADAEDLLQDTFRQAYRH